MKIAILMVTTYILDCVVIGTKPCKYFQLNSPHFDGREGIFSKVNIDKLIPDKWRLQQFYDDGVRQPDSYPAFVKPEWGQNARGIIKVASDEELQAVREEIASSRIRYLVQQGASERREFEIFSIAHHDNSHRYAVLTVTEAVNDKESNPINSIYNGHTRYLEITDQFNADEKSRLWEFVREIGDFKISRMSACANSLEDLLNGRFHVIEINLFLPMPINMLDRKYRWWDIWGMIRNYMMCLARLTKTRDKSLPEKPVFTKNMLYNRQSKVLNYLRSKI